MSESSSSGSSKTSPSQAGNDLTDLISYSKKLEESGEFPETPSTESSLVLEPPPQETITEFESLDTLPPGDPVPDFPLSLEAPAEETVHQSAPIGLEAELEPQSAASTNDFSLDLDLDLNLESATHTVDDSIDAAPPVPELRPPVQAPAAVVEPLQIPEAPLQNQRILASRAPIPAAFPFTLKIHGALPAHHQSRLENLLEKESLGISAADLRPQLEAGRILIPRISEYALILVLQALRDAPVDFEAHPSDLADLSPEDSSAFPAFESATPAGRRAGELDSDGHHRARLIESIVVIPAAPRGGSSLEERERLFKAMDTLTASMILSAGIVRSPGSSDYIEAIERLKSELRHKAFWKGADTLLDFSIQLQPISSVGQEGVAYRLTASGCAARRLGSETESRSRPTPS